MTVGRHPVAEANEESPFGSLTPSEFYSKHSVSHETSSFKSCKDDLNIFTQWWTPLDVTPRGIICIVHGFTGETSWFVQLTSVFLAESGGFVVCALDHRGHGFSDGLVAHVPDVQPVVDDCIAFFGSFRSRYPPNLPCFLYSESLGGAIALLIHLKTKSESMRWDGIVLNGAMCGISDKIKPPWPLEHLLSLAAAVVPTWRIVPTKGTIVGVSFKEEWKRKLAAASPRRPMGRPRAATTLELLRICREIQERSEEVTAPLLIVHGEEDVLCDPSSVQDLHRRASSQDKTLKIYDGMWHQLVGEPDDNVRLVFGEVLDWLTSRSSPSQSSPSTTAATEQ